MKRVLEKSWDFSFALCVCCLLLVGCADPATTQDDPASTSSSTPTASSSTSTSSVAPAPPAASETISEFKFRGENCRQLAAIHPVPSGEISALLPDGILPAGIGFWAGLGEDQGTQVGTLGTITAECNRHDGASSPVGFSVISTVIQEIERPELPPAAMSFYIFAMGINDEPMRDAFEARSWLIARSRGVEVSSHLQAGLPVEASFMNAEVVENGQTIMSMTAVTSAEFQTTGDGEPFILRFWSTGSEGLVFMDVQSDKDAQLGALQCEYAESGVYNEYLGAKCTPPQGIAATHDNFQLTIDLPALEGS